MPALIVLYALLGMPFDPAWLDVPEPDYLCGGGCMNRQTLPAPYVPPNLVSDTRMDVPAVLVAHPCSTKNGKYAACINVNMEEFTCEDKRRVLLTSEDGQKHCILFVNPTPEPPCSKYVYLIPVYEGKDAPGEAQMVKVCEVSK